ncbi:MAG: helix-turn-helix transcriptional regulator [Actinomycetota bacterium]
MAVWHSSGDVLRWWRRDVKRLTQKEVASRLNVRSSALSNWERGTRAVSFDLGEIDAALEGGQTLEGLLWGHGTPEGMDPGRVWTQVFPGPSRPVWVWIRSQAERLRIEGEWGVARFETEVTLEANGFFVTVGASLPDSPVILQFSEPGWACFGSGELPTEIPEASVVSALSMMRRSSADGPFMELFSSSLASKVASGSPDVDEIDNVAPDAVESYLAGSGKDADRVVPKTWSPHPEGIEAVERARFARLREAKGLSLAAMADRLTRMTGTEVGRDTLRRFETDVGQPHDPMLPLALDFALGADGRLAVLELQAGQGSGTVMFPPYWRGPVWFQLTDPQGEALVVLRRGDWHRELTIDRTAQLSAHWFDPQVPLRLLARPTTTWSVGVGRLSGAKPIDQNWVPTRVDVAQQAIVDTEQAILDAIERRKKDEGPETESGS